MSTKAKTTEVKEGAEDAPETGMVVAPQKTFSLKPKDLTEAMSYAKMMAESELVPTHFRAKPANVLIAVQMGLEIGLSPMQAIQNIAVINGKPCVYGDAGKALLYSGGCKIEESDVEEIKKTQVAKCRITRPNGQTTERTFSVEDAKTAGLWGKAGPWTQYPYRQLSWRAFWFAARDGAADMLRGLAGAEELDDLKHNAITVENEFKKPQAVAPADGAPAKAKPVTEKPASEPVTAEIVNEVMNPLINDVFRTKLPDGKYCYRIVTDSNVALHTDNEETAKSAKNIKMSSLRPHITYKTGFKREGIAAPVNWIVAWDLNVEVAAPGPQDEAPY